MDATAATGIAGILATLAGVYLGAWMSRRTARDLARDQRQWSERHAVRQRQDEEAAMLDERLLEALSDLPTFAGPARELGPKIGATRVRMLQAFSRGTVLDDEEITERVRALDLAMLVAASYAEAALYQWGDSGPGTPEPGINPWPITVAVGELRQALSRFRRHIDPPPAKFPRAPEVLALSHRDGRQLGLNPIMDLLIEREAPP